MVSIKGRVIDQTTDGADEHLKNLLKNILVLENTIIENQITANHSKD
jgi:hypothetical protein